MNSPDQYYSERCAISSYAFSKEKNTRLLFKVNFVTVGIIYGKLYTLPCLNHYCSKDQLNNDQVNYYIQQK